jgi:hypothetical protein
VKLSGVTPLPGKTKNAAAGHRQSKPNDRFHFRVSFCDRAPRPYRFEPHCDRRKVNVRASVPNARAGVCKLRPSRYSQSCSRKRRPKASSRYLRRLTSVRCAASLAFAGVLAFAPVITRLTPALTFTVVLAFAGVFTFFCVGHRLQGDAGIARGARRMDTHSERPSEKAGHRSASNYCFGWFDHVFAFFFMVVICFSL